MSNLFSNFDTIQKLAERSNSGGAQQGFLGYIYWSKKESTNGRTEKVLRMLHDGSIVVALHENIEDTAGKRNEVVCRGNDFIETHGDCPACARNLPIISRGFGLAVQRAEERAEGRMQVADRSIEIEKDGKKKNVPYLGTVKQSISNFWNNMAPLALRYGTVVTRDILVTRTNFDTSTTYSFLPFDPEPDLDSEEKVLKRYESVLEGRSPQEAILNRLNMLASDRHFEKVLGTGWKSAPSGSSDAVAGASSGGYGDQASAGHDNGGTSFADLKNRLTGY